MNVSDFKGHISGDVRWANNGSYCYFHPNELPFDIEPNTKAMESFISVSKELGKLDGMLSSMDEGEITVLSFAFSIKESTSSSSIEGTRSTIDDVFRSRLISPSDNNMKYDNQEIENYKDALFYGFGELERKRVIDSEFLKELHIILMKGVRGENKSPGVFKTEQNAIGTPGDTLETAKIVPADPISTPYLIDNLCEYIEGSDDIRSMTVALSHVQFESIHPFRDGNGRVGRLLMMLLLKKYDLLTHPVLFISEYLERNRSAYIGLLYMVSSEDCFDEWMIFLAKGIEEQSIKAQNMILSLRRYKEHLSTLLSGDRLSASFLLFKKPYINAKDVSISLGISIPTATKIVEDLENAGIVREITGKRRNRVFVADDIMEILRGRSTYSAELNR